MMNLKRFLAIALSLAMLLCMMPAGTVAHAEETQKITKEDLSFEQLDAADITAERPQTLSESEDLTLEQAIANSTGMVEVFIVMEGESIMEENIAAIADETTLEKSKDLEKLQAEVVSRIEETVLKGDSLKIDYNYTWLFNGIAAQIPTESISEVKAVEGVKDVVIQPVYRVFEETSSDAVPMTSSDGVMIGRENTWAQGYTGQGIKIAVIDTGLDQDHQNFQALSEDKLTADSATKESIAAVLGELNASDRMEGLTPDDVYYSSKVVYGFNYADDNTDITHSNDQQGDHGTHVAGIAAANKVDESAVVGVAPDAQLYILKVFGATRAGSGSDIIAALEDAVTLGVDVINMSLGTDAGFPTSAYDFVNEVYGRVKDAGIVLSVAAGNSFTAGYMNMWGTNANLTSNPDNAVIGEPAVYEPALSVAAVENWKIQRNYIQVSDGYQIGYADNGSQFGQPALTTLTGEYELVVVPGYGAAADFEGLDLTGKVALIQRGIESFVDKCTNAYNAGAIACLVYNNTSGEFGMNLTDLKVQIPGGAITMADGSYLISALEENPQLTISFPEETAAIPSINAYQMSEFSSWGVSPDLGLEPDITAPGGNIYSTIDNGQYGLMSGTSMAAPNVSGLSALVLEYAKKNFEGEDYRTVVQNLLMSTSAPLTYGDSDLYYSPRSQGSGLANAFNAVATTTYLTVDGCDVPKIELGDDAGRTGSYAYSFNVHNFGTAPAYYNLDTVVQSEGVMTNDNYEGVYFMSAAPVALAASSAETASDLVLTYDVNNSGTTTSRDAYLIYLAATGNAADDSWADVAFRYDADCSEAVDTADVQAYLDALVGNDSEADLADQVLEVAPGAESEISVSVTLAEDAKAYLDTYFVNGGYVEGYTLLTAMNEGGMDLSLPYLGFYGSWDEAPIIDDGDYWELFGADSDAVIGNQYYNILFTNLEGEDNATQPGLNIFFENMPIDMEHITLSPNDDGSFDTVDDIYTSLLRNAGTLTYRYSNTTTGDVYYEYTAKNAYKSIYKAAYGSIVPNVYSWFEGEIPLWDWATDMEGNEIELTNNTKLLLEVIATGAYEGATPETWAVPITIDLEAPTMISATRVTDTENGTVSLELSLKDNVGVSAIALMTGDLTEYVDMQPVQKQGTDENGNSTYTITFDLTDVSGKLAIVLYDYAMNTSAYGLNAGGEGASYGELVGYQSTASGVSSWVSFGTDVNKDEARIFADDMGIVAAEYVAGYVFAQTKSGALYGFPYEDMLKDTFKLESTYVAQLDNVYQDLAYSYAEGKLYGLYLYDDGDSTSTEIHSINIKGEYYDDYYGATVAPYQEDWVLAQGDLYGLGMAIDDAGTIYVLGNYGEGTYTDDGDYSIVMEDTASIWSVGLEYDKWSDSYLLGYGLTKLGNIAQTTDYLQSMTWDHNTEKLYWARFSGNILTQTAELYEIDPSQITDEIVYTEKLGDLSGETCAMFAPLTEESAAKDTHQNLPEMDSSVVGTPILRDDTVTMNLTGVKTLVYDMDPWYTAHKSVVWSSNNTDVVTVDQNGTIVAVGGGSAVITVANKADEAKFDTVTVEVTALDLSIDGIFTAQSAGVGSTGGVSLYNFSMNKGISSFTVGNAITAPETMSEFSLDLSTSVMGRGSIWACEYGNVGMVYQIDPATGAVVDYLEPINGDMVCGFTYSEARDSFTAVSNKYLYVDMALTHQQQEEMNKANEGKIAADFDFHRVNMLPYLLEAGNGFSTGETGFGAESEIVFSGITSIAGGVKDSYGETYYYDTYKDYMGNWASGMEMNYQPDQTLVLLDNVGRLWYVNQVFNVSVKTDDWGNQEISTADGGTLDGSRNGVMTYAYTAEDGTAAYGALHITGITETALTQMFRDGTMPRITYHFSDIEFAGYTADGDPMFFMSLYDYWNNGTTNELYLYIPGHDTGEWDSETNSAVFTPDRLFSLGNTGEHNIIASIHAAKVTGGLDPEEDSAETLNTLGVGLCSAK